MTSKKPTERPRPRQTFEQALLAFVKGYAGPRPELVPLLDAAVWYLMAEGLNKARERTDGKHGVERIQELGWIYVHGLMTEPLYQSLLTADAEFTRQVFTRPQSYVRTELQHWLAGLIREEQEAGALEARIPALTLADDLIRIGEELIYFDTDIAPLDKPGVAVQRLGEVLTALAPGLGDDLAVAM